MPSLFKKQFRRKTTRKAPMKKKRALETKKEVKKDLKTLSMHLRKGERSMSYKGQCLPPVWHTKFMFADAGVINSGNDNYRINDLYNFEISGSPTLFPSYYHTFFPVNGTLYNNWAVYAVDIQMDIFAQYTNVSTVPITIVWFDACEQNANGITNLDQAITLPGSKKYLLGPNSAGDGGHITIRRKFNLCDYMANAFDISYTGLPATSPTNGIYSQIQFYNGTSGVLITAGSASITTNLKVIFDVSCYGLKYNTVS